MSLYQQKGLFEVKALDLSVDEGSNEVVAVISAGVVDRQKEVVAPLGLSKKQYQGVKIFKNHDTTTDPYGIVKWIKRDGDKVLMKFKAFTISPEQQLMWEYLKAGVYDQYSIGFMYDRESAGPPTPQELKKFPHWEGANRIIRNWEPYEVSIVGVPANQETLTLAISKGLSATAIKSLEAEIAVATKAVAPEQAAKKSYTKKDFYSALLKELKR